MPQTISKLVTDLPAQVQDRLLANHPASTFADYFETLALVLETKRELELEARKRELALCEAS